MSFLAEKLYVFNANQQKVLSTDEVREFLNGTVPDSHAAQLFEQEASAKDPSHSKPDPDIIQAALMCADVPPHNALILGDTAASASQAGVQTIALRCGGWSDRDLQGALAIYESSADSPDTLCNVPSGTHRRS